VEEIMLVQFCVFDRHYLDRLRRGELLTGEHFADYFGRLIRLRLGSRLNSKVALEDIRQETFLRVWMALHKDNGIRQPERFGAFVSSVCNNVMREQRRRHGKEDQAEDDSVASLPDTGIQVPEIIASQESRLHVGRVLAKLPAKTRSLIQKVFLDECDKDEVCRELGVDRQYFRVLLHRALRQFKQQYLKEMRAESPLHPAKHPSRSSFQASLNYGNGVFRNVTEFRKEQRERARV
jgi:RNA polymerase sigma-70 factor (ECF subfamily)